jgi:hypothetical protein
MKDNSRLQPRFKSQAPHLKNPSNFYPFLNYFNSTDQGLKQGKSTGCLVLISSIFRRPVQDFQKTPRAIGKIGKIKSDPAGF